MPATEAHSELTHMIDCLNEAMKWSTQADGTLKSGVRGGADIAYTLYAVHLTILSARTQVTTLAHKLRP